MNRVRFHSDFNMIALRPCDILRESITERIAPHVRCLRALLLRSNQGAVLSPTTAFILNVFKTIEVKWLHLAFLAFRRGESFLATIVLRDCTAFGVFVITK